MDFKKHLNCNHIHKCTATQFSVNLFIFPSAAQLLFISLFVGLVWYVQKLTVITASHWQRKSIVINDIKGDK